jgi:hypothetical protein
LPSIYTVVAELRRETGAIIHEGFEPVIPLFELTLDHTVAATDNKNNLVVVHEWK